MKTYLKKAMAFIQDEEGASAIEYALLVGLIALAIIVGAQNLGSAINGKFQAAVTQLNSAGQ